VSTPPLTPGKAPAEISRHLQRITHQHFFKAFEDWLALAVNAFMRDDNAYMANMRRYGPREAPMNERDHPADHFARALGTWMAAMQTESADYLGSLQLGCRRQRVGESFIPWRRKRLHRRSQARKSDRSKGSRRSLFSIKALAISPYAGAYLKP